MRYLGLIAALSMSAFTSLPAAAQTATSSTSSAANNTANQVSASGAIAAGGQSSIVFPEQPSRVEAVQSGSTTNRVEAAPSLGGLAVGGGHPCAWTPGSGQISIIGGGIGGAKMVIDEACMLAIMGSASGDKRLHNASLYIIASRDKTACLALRQQGLISSASSCGERKQLRDKTTVATRSNATPGVTEVGYNKCEKRADGKVGIRYKYGADKEVAKAQCLTALGY